MICQKCGAELKAGVKYCRECGARVEEEPKKVCPKCGTDIRTGAKFCFQCGADLDLSDRVYAEKANTSQEGEYHTYTEPTDDPTSEEKSAFAYYVDDILTQIKSAISQKTIKYYQPVILSIALVVMISSVIVGGYGFFTKKQQKTISNDSAEVYQTIRKGSVYSYKCDEFNLYIARAISDTVIKVERWERTSIFSRLKTAYEEDVGTYKINDKKNGFTWMDEDQTAFLLLIDDDDNSSLKEDTPLPFTIYLQDTDKNKGTSCDNRIARYYCKYDSTYMYRAIVLSDRLVKFEQWEKGLFSDEYSYIRDWWVIDLAQEKTDFRWVDDDHTAFTITTQDPDLIYNDYLTEWEEGKFISFELENSDYRYKSVKEYLEHHNSLPKEDQSES